MIYVSAIRRHKAAWTFIFGEVICTYSEAILGSYQWRCGTGAQEALQAIAWLQPQLQK